MNFYKVLFTVACTFCLSFPLYPNKKFIADKAIKELFARELGINLDQEWSEIYNNGELLEEKRTSLIQKITDSWNSHVQEINTLFKTHLNKKYHNPQAKNSSVENTFDALFNDVFQDNDIFTTHIQTEGKNPEHILDSLTDAFLQAVCSYLDQAALEKRLQQQTSNHDFIYFLLLIEQEDQTISLKTIPTVPQHDKLKKSYSNDDLQTWMQQYTAQQSILQLNAAPDKNFCKFACRWFMRCSAALLLFAILLEQIIHAIGEETVEEFIDRLERL